MNKKKIKLQNKKNKINIKKFNNKIKLNYV